MVSWVFYASKSIFVCCINGVLGSITHLGWARCRNSIVPLAGKFLRVSEKFHIHLCWRGYVGVTNFTEILLLLKWSHCWCFSHVNKMFWLVQKLCMSYEKDFFTNYIFKPFKNIYKLIWHCNIFVWFWCSYLNYLCQSQYVYLSCMFINITILTNTFRESTRRMFIFKNLYMNGNINVTILTTLPVLS